VTQDGSKLFEERGAAMKSFSNGQLAAHLGRSLRSVYQSTLEEPLPDGLAALVQRLEGQDSPEPQPMPQTPDTAPVPSREDESSQESPEAVLESRSLIP